MAMIGFIEPPGRLRVGISPAEAVFGHDFELPDEVLKKHDANMEAIDAMNDVDDSGAVIRSVGSHAILADALIQT